MDKEVRKKALLAASVAGLLAVTVMVAPNTALAEGEPEHCYGINACKGTGDCGGKGHSCAGQNACKGQGFLTLPQGACTKIAGGSLTPAV